MERCNDGGGIELREPHNLDMMQQVSLAWGLEPSAVAKAYTVTNELDRVWQCVTRTAIRVPDDNRDLVFYVLYERQAAFLMSRLTNAIVDWKLASLFRVDEGGAPVGNTNAKGKTGKGCPIRLFLTDHGVNKMTAGRWIEAFKKANGREPSELNPSDFVLLGKAAETVSSGKRLGKQWSWKV